MKIGRNASCPCGSGKKYKKCCLGKVNFEANYKKDDTFISEPIKDYGTPNISNDFFENKFSKMPSAAALQHFRMSNDVDNLIGKILDPVLPDERKNKIEEERIKEINNPDELLGVLEQDIDTANNGLLINKMLEYDDFIIPKLIAKLENNTDDFFVEFSIRLIRESKNDFYSELVLNTLPSIKHAYTLSTVCLLLGFIGKKEALKPV